MENDDFFFADEQTFNHQQSKTTPNNNEICAIATAFYVPVFLFLASSAKSYFVQDVEVSIFFY